MTINYQMKQQTHNKYSSKQYTGTLQKATCITFNVSKIKCKSGPAQAENITHGIAH